MKDFKALHSTFDYIISGHGIYTGLVEDFRAGLDEAVLARNLEKLGIKIVSQIFRGASEEIDTKKVDSVMNDIISGKIDETYKLPEGMTQKLLHILTRVASLIPEEVVEFGDVAAKIALWPKAAVEAEELVERAKYLSKKVKRDYEEDLIDILKHGTLSTLLKTGRIQEESGHFGEKELGDLVSIVNERDYSEEKLILLRKMQEETKEYCKRNNLELISGKDLQKIHEKYGVGPLATINVINYLPDFWACLKEKRKNEEHLPRNANPEWMKYATKGHQDLVDRLIENPEIIESGLELMQSEYNFGEGWARADIVYKDRNGNPLVVEVKQNAVRNGDGFDNALKAVEQTAGYRAAVEAILDYCPLTREQDHNVRGMLVAYNIDDDAKTALEKNECEYKEIARDEGEE